MKLTKQQQIREVVAGLGLGLLELHNARLKKSSKIDFELAFAFAWRRWPGASDYPSIKGDTGPNGANAVMIGVHKSARSKSAVRWVRNGSDLVVVGLGDWAPEDHLGLVGERSLASWVSLAELFLSWPRRDAATT